jgi:serine phosphatase RsbU (regulator of sigma subunit)/PAS domain-containing protein
VDTGTVAQLAGRHMTAPPAAAADRSHGFGGPGAADQPDALDEPDPPEKPRFIIKPPVRSRRGASTWPASPATFGLSLGGRVLQWSSGAAELFDLPPERAIGRAAADLLAPGGRHEQVADALAEVAAGRRWTGVLSLPAADGEERDIEFWWDPATGPSGAQISVSAVVPVVPGGQIGPPRIGDQERFALLNEASTRIGTTLDLGNTAAELMDVAVPRFADAAGILVQERLVTDGEFPERDTDGSAVVRRLAVGVADSNPEDWAAAFPVGEVTIYPAWTPYARCMETGESILFARVDTEVAERIGRRAWKREAVFKVLDHTSMLVVPLKARGKVLGFVVYTRNPDSLEFTGEDVALAEELAARAAICIDNACLFNRERRTALTLQSSLLPRELVDPLGLDLAHRYLPASDLTGVGGDWYDVIPLPGCRTALVVGDVMGHGTQAAATMGQLRTAVRTLAALDLSPDEVLFRLDQMTQDVYGTQIATCVYATYDPVSRRCVIARAGHVPPILVSAPGRAEVLELPPGLPLGIGGEPFTASELTLPDESMLALYTDGLVESRGRDIDAGLAALLTKLTQRCHDLEETGTTVIETVRPGADRDDIALLLARVRALTADQVASITLSPQPMSVRSARGFVRSTLLAWGLDTVVDTAELVASELVTNAVRHATGWVGLRLLRGQAIVCEVTDGSVSSPLLRAPDVFDISGRGVQMVNVLAQRWGTRTVPGGKIVWCELPVPPPLPRASALPGPDNAPATIAP